MGEKPEGIIFLIPALLENCVVPERLSRWQWVDPSLDRWGMNQHGCEKLLRALKIRSDSIGANLIQLKSNAENSLRVACLGASGLWKNHLFNKIKKHGFDFESAPLHRPLSGCLTIAQPS